MVRQFHNVCDVIYGRPQTLENGVYYANEDILIFCSLIKPNHNNGRNCNVEKPLFLFPLKLNRNSKLHFHKQRICFVREKRGMTSKKKNIEKKNLEKWKNFKKGKNFEIEELRMIRFSKPINLSFLVAACQVSIVFLFSCFLFFHFISFGKSMTVIML